MKDRTVCFTGHREIPALKSLTIKNQLKNILVKLIDEGYCYFGAGGALGFDTIAAQAVLDLRKKYPHIKLILVLPCISQADRWSDDDKNRYESIKSQADKVIYTSERYTRECMYKRNRHLVDHSSVCICYLTKETGGTAYTVNYALSKGLRVENVAKK